MAIVIALLCCTMYRENIHIWFFISDSDHIVRNKYKQKYKYLHILNWIQTTFHFYFVSKVPSAFQQHFKIHFIYKIIFSFIYYYLFWTFPLRDNWQLAMANLLLPLYFFNESRNHVTMWFKHSARRWRHRTMKVLDYISSLIIHFSDRFINLHCFLRHIKVFSIQFEQLLIIEWQMSVNTMCVVDFQ